MSGLVPLAVLVLVAWATRNCAPGSARHSSSSSADSRS